MKVVLFRGWARSGDTATYEDLAHRGVGGTELQLLLHAQGLRALGHDVVVLGVTDKQVEEEGILFEASPDEEGTATAVRMHSDADAYLINSTVEVGRLRAMLPGSLFVHVAQNGPDLRARRYIDLYAFVGEGQFAKYSTRYRSQRHRFVLLPNVLPWERYYERAYMLGVERGVPTVVWVGGFTKPGLRQWGLALAAVMREYPDLTLKLCGPAYASSTFARLPEALAGVGLPDDRVTVLNQTLPALARTLASATVVITSLGGEDGPVSYLDGHAFGVPVLSGNDVVGFHANPLGSGFRCTSVEECANSLRWVVDNPARAERLGVAGREFVLSRFTERNQRVALALLMNVAVDWRTGGRDLLAHRSRSDRRYPLSYWTERVAAKFRSAP